MTNNIKILDASWASDQSIIKKIRNDVFIVEQNVPKELEWDTEDASAIHCLALYKNLPAAYGRLQVNSQIGRIAVLSEFRRKGIATKIVEHLINISHNKQELFLHAQTYIVPFYEKMGFKTEGKEFIEAGIPHVLMRFI